MQGAKRSDRGAILGLVFGVFCFLCPFFASADAVLVSATPYFVGSGLNENVRLYNPDGAKASYPGYTFSWGTTFDMESITFNYCMTATGTGPNSFSGHIWIYSINWDEPYTMPGSVMPTDYNYLAKASSTYDLLPFSWPICGTGYYPMTYVLPQKLRIEAGQQIAMIWRWTDGWQWDYTRQQSTTNNPPNSQYMYWCYQGSCPLSPYPGTTGYGGIWPIASTSTQPVFRVNGTLVTASEVADLLLDECPVLGIDFCTPFSKIISWAFVLPDTAFDQFLSLGDQIKNKPPFGYFIGAYDAIATISTTSTAFLIGTTTGTMTYIFSPIRTGLIWIIWLAGLIWMIKHANDLQP